MGKIKAHVKHLVEVKEFTRRDLVRLRTGEREQRLRELKVKAIRQGYSVSRVFDLDLKVSGAEKAGKTVKEAIQKQQSTFSIFYKPPIPQDYDSAQAYALYSMKEHEALTKVFYHELTEDEKKHRLNDIKREAEERKLAQKQREDRRKKWSDFCRTQQDDGMFVPESASTYKALQVNKTAEFPQVPTFLYGDDRIIPLSDVPRRICTWGKDWNMFPSHWDAAFWIQHFPSYAPGRWSWDRGIGSNQDWEDYQQMRRMVKTPTYLSWGSKYLLPTYIEGKQLLTQWGYEHGFHPGDFDVKLEILPGEKSYLDTGHSSLISHAFKFPGCFPKIKALFQMWLWDYEHRIDITHYRGRPSPGGLFWNVYELMLYYLHYCFYDMPALLSNYGTPIEWKVYRSMIENNDDIDSETDIVHAYTNYKVRGSFHCREYEGMQFVVAQKPPLNFDLPSGDWWCYPRNYTYEMRRGMRKVNDHFSRLKAPLYERLIEISDVSRAEDVKPPWRQGGFQNFGFFLDQFQFHVLPFLKRIKVVLDLMTRPFACKDDSMSRMDGTFWLISRAGKILLNKKAKDKDKGAWEDLKLFMEKEGNVLKMATEYLFSEYKKVYKIMTRVADRLSYAKSKFELAQGDWRFFAPLNFVHGCFRLTLLHGIHLITGFTERVYGVPTLYSYGKFKKELNPYQHCWLEQFPYKTGWTLYKEDCEREKDWGIAGFNTPTRVVYVPPDDEEQKERIPLNFYWIGDDNCHIQFPVEKDRCVNLHDLDFKAKSIVFKNLFHNAFDILTISQDQLSKALYYLQKYEPKDGKKPRVFMTPTGPVGPLDTGWTELYELMADKNKSNSQDIVFLSPFEELMDDFWTVIYQAAYGASGRSRYRHMLGPGAFRLSQSMEMVYDLHNEVSLMLPHLRHMKRYLKNNLDIVRGLSQCVTSKDTTKFVWGRVRRMHLGTLSSPFLRVKSQKFFAVRFSMSEEDNAQLCQLISQEYPDTYKIVLKKLRQWYFLQDGRNPGYVKTEKYRWQRYLAGLQKEPYNVSSYHAGSRQSYYPLISQARHNFMFKDYTV